MKLTRPGRAAISAGLSLALVLSPLSTTLAAAATNDSIESTSAELDTARARLDELSSQCEDKFAELEDARAELEGTNQQIKDTEEQIQAKEEELVAARVVLSESLSENYKSGVNFLSFVLGSSTFDDLVSRVYYADKVSEHQSKAINTVLDIQEELDVQKANLVTEQQKQEDLVAKSEKAAGELQSAVAEQQEYVNGLDSQLQAQIQAQIEAERAAAEEQARIEAEQRAAEAAAADAAQSEEQSSDAGATTTPTANNNGGARTTTTNSGSSTRSNSSSGSSSSSSSSSSSGSSSSGRTVGNMGSGVSAAIRYALSQKGVSYSWGGNAIEGVEFDCSGLVWWAFNRAGISIPRGQRLANGRGNSMIGWCLDSGGWTTNQANLQAGDLMFWGSSVNSTSHVGLCIGGGQMIHANWSGVEVTSVYYSSGSFVGGGPIA
ncbi:MAG: NlpC/P60 family protein [Acidobacteriota bacterium]|nr:NlpC/P60 family protein [Acidobacteriota bacterium]